MLTNIYLNAVRSHVDTLYRRGRIDSLVYHDIGADEQTDPTLVAHRVYGRRDDVDVVMLCAGTNRIGEQLPLGRIYLPNAAILMQLKRQYLSE